MVDVINTDFHYDQEAYKASGMTKPVGTGTDGSTLSLLNRHRL